MSLWSVLENGWNTVTTQIKSAWDWAWSVTPQHVVNYGRNTALQVAEQGLAVPEALRTLVSNPDANRVVRGVGHMFYRAIPVMVVNLANTLLQDYARRGHEEEGWSPYGVLLCGFTLVDSAVKIYTVCQSLEPVAEVALLGLAGPKAFKSNALAGSYTYCSEHGCNPQRFAKGFGRDLFYLWVIERAAAAAEITPAFEIAVLSPLIKVIGPVLAQLIRVYGSGELISGLVITDLCERHRNVQPEAVAALGITFETSRRVMDYLLNTYTGMPPALYYWVLRNILLLAHVNVASHMKLPLEDSNAPGMGALKISKIGTRFVADAVFSGVVARLPDIVALIPDNGPALISLPSLLQLAKRAFESDMADNSAPGWVQNIRLTLVPPMFHSLKNLLNDPVFKFYWLDARSKALTSINELENSVKGARTVAAIAAMRDVVAAAVDYQYGIPKEVTRTVLSLSQDDDFWDLMTAIKFWLIRQGITPDSALVPEQDQNPTVPLNGERQLVILSPGADTRPASPPDKLRSVVVVAESCVLDPAKLRPAAPKSTGSSVTHAPQGLFRKKGPKKDPISDAVFVPTAGPSGLNASLQ